MSMRFVLGGQDAEMSLIRTLILAAIADGLDAEIVEAAPGPRSEAQYASTVEPRAGDVWIECAPADGGRAAIEAAGGTRIDHHQPGDPGYGRPVEEAFAASSLGQVLRLLLDRGVSPQALGLAPQDVGPFGADPGFQALPLMWGGSFGWISAGDPPGIFWSVPPEWIAVGAADHDPVSFAGGRIPGWTATTAREFLIARAVAAGRGFTAADVAEALRLIEAAPTLPGFPQVYDLRGIPELLPATMGADRQPVPGTGGRLGSAAFHAVICLPGRAALNWGDQGVRPAGRHLGLIGDTAALPVAAILEAVPGIVDPYGAPGKACGGYVRSI